jgi:5-methylcytosine-specific restriction endonuclease McrA
MSKQQREKQQLQSKARRYFGRGDLWKLFAATAQKLGRAAPTDKGTGYALLREFFATVPKVTKLTRIQQAAYRETAACWVRPTYDGDVTSDAFLSSYEWRRVRMVVLKQHGARCQCCGATAKDGVRLHVDHIKPRKHFPELALDTANLQVLCEVCNHGKGNWDTTDWRIA